ncbi:MAG: hypothetical protein EI684_06460 [Candidatus Viridilinea halotolerans]|uniref:DUF1269 domain-containing protein n=1 Tax=Candidatus Viridilinea halotolerans TaxID=2491704 RepID=A0A426U488_9CHLR|nr:MAG: hypothetical protein EI684_06460 [Candidatus Viridilinea halotolerans]
MIRTITGLFDTVDDAQNVAKDLMDHDIPREDISILIRNESDTNERQQEVGEEHPTRSGEAGSGEEDSVGSGAIGGSVAGGAVGLLVGAGLLTIPGIGPVLAIGPLAAAIGTLGAAAGATALGAGVGAGVGGLAGGLMDAGVPEESAHNYAEGVRRGGVLLTVSLDMATAERIDVDAVLRRHGAVDIDERRKDWHETDASASATDTAHTDFAQNEHSAPSSTAYPEFAQGQRPTPPSPTYPEFAQDQRSTSPSPAYPERTQDAHATPSSTARSEFAQDEHVTPSSTARAEFARSVHGTNGNNDRDFQTHYQSTVAAGGRPYSDYAPAYTFGKDMATATRVRGHTWDAVEPDLRRTWDQNHPNTWDEFKAAVRYAWEKSPGQH